MEDGRGEKWLFTLMPKGGRGVGYGNRKGRLVVSGLDASRLGW